MKRSLLAMLLIVVFAVTALIAGDFERIPASQSFRVKCPSSDWTLAADAIDTSVAKVIDLKVYKNVLQLYWYVTFTNNAGDSLGKITFETSADNLNWTTLQTDSMYESDSSFACDSLFTLGTFHRYIRWRTWTQVNAADTGAHTILIQIEGIDNE